MKVNYISTVKVHIPIVLLCLFNYASVEGASCNAIDETKNYCANPTQAENIDIAWFHQHFNDGWYLQFGNQVIQKFISKLLPENEEHQICPKVNIDFIEDTNEFFVFLYDYTKNDTQASLNCTASDCIFTSSDKNYVEEVKGYTSYFDGKEDHNVLSVVLCFKNGEVGWYVLSVSKTLSEEETKTLNEHLKSLGFNSDRVPLQSSTCE